MSTEAKERHQSRTLGFIMISLLLVFAFWSGHFIGSSKAQKVATVSARGYVTRAEFKELRVSIAKKVADAKEPGKINYMPARLCYFKDKK